MTSGMISMAKMNHLGGRIVCNWTLAAFVFEKF